MPATRPVTVLTLLYILISFCLLSVVLAVITRQRDQIMPAALDELLKSTAALYATPVSVAAAAALARGRRAQVRYPRAAAILVALWGLVMATPYILLAFTSNIHYRQVTAFYDAAWKDWNFLISGVLAFSASNSDKTGT
jgi:hypothetical protein